MFYFGKVCFNSKLPVALHFTRDFTYNQQPATLFGEKCVRLYGVIINDYTIVVAVGGLVECAASFIT
jgi:hypothetical protein